MRRFIGLALIVGGILTLTGCGKSGSTVTAERSQRWQQVRQAQT